MAINYSNTPGMEVISYAMDETLIAQTDQTGNNTVVVSDDIVTAGNGNINASYYDTYVGRKVYINLGDPDEQERIVISQTAGSTVTNSIILTVHEDWDTNPVVTDDTIHVSYMIPDLDVASGGSGIGYQTRTGIWTCTNRLQIGNGTDPAGLFLGHNVALELFDESSDPNCVVHEHGRFDIGYLSGGVPVGGGIVICVNGNDSEIAIEWETGAISRLYDTLIWSQLNQLDFIMHPSSDVAGNKVKLIFVSYEAQFFGADFTDLTIVGAQGTNDYQRVDSNTVFNGVILSETLGWHTTLSDTTTETVTIAGCIFTGNADYITLVDNKTWNMIDPTWGLTSHSDIEDTAVTGTAAVYSQVSVTALVAEADGTLLQDALINIYENTQLADLVLETTTDVNGDAAGVFNYIGMTWTTGTGSTTTYGGHSRQAGKWLYLPLVFAQSSTEAFDGSITLAPDNNITQTTQATALSDGSTITWNEDTNPSSVIEFSGGSGGTIGLAVGDTITDATTGADGIVTQILSGDTTAGEIHLKTRDANDFGNGNTIGNGGDGWTATYVASSQQDFSIWIDGQTIAYTGIYDYLAAKQNETTLSADGEKIWEWCRSAQTQPLYATGSSFYTERSNSKGIFIVDGGSGTLDYATDDAGGTWTAPASVTIEVEVLDDATGLPIEFAHVQLYEDDFTTVVLSAATNASGIASAPYAYTTEEVVSGWARNVDFVADDYRPEDISGTITSLGLSLTVRLTPTS